MNLFEIVSVSTSVGLLGGYHLWLAHQIAHRPARTIVGYSTAGRREWVRSIMQQRRDILAVQTLRNWSTAASFLATTAILIATGVLHFLTTIPEQPQLLHELNFLGSPDPAWLTVKLLVMVIDLLVVFFNFVVAIRYYNHVSIEVNVPDPTEANIAAVQRLMDRGGLHFTLGMRCFYLSVPLALWLFGALWLLLGSIALCIALFGMDRLH